MKKTYYCEECGFEYDEELAADFDGCPACGSHDVREKEEDE